MYYPIYCFQSWQAGHTRACYFLFYGAQLYKTMLLQVMPIYLCNLRKRPFHAALRPFPCSDGKRHFRDFSLGCLFLLFQVGLRTELSLTPSARATSVLLMSKHKGVWPACPAAPRRSRPTLQQRCHKYRNVLVTSGYSCRKIKT